MVSIDLFSCLLLLLMIKWDCGRGILSPTPGLGVEVRMCSYAEVAVAENGRPRARKEVRGMAVREETRREHWRENILRAITDYLVYERRRCVCEKINCRCGREKQSGKGKGDMMMIVAAPRKSRRVNPGNSRDSFCT